MTPCLLRVNKSIFQVHKKFKLFVISNMDNLCQLFPIIVLTFWDTIIESVLTQIRSISPFLLAPVVNGDLVGVRCSAVTAYQSGFTITYLMKTKFYLSQHFIWSLGNQFLLYSINKMSLRGIKWDSYSLSQKLNLSWHNHSVKMQQWLLTKLLSG